MTERDHPGWLDVPDWWSHQHYPPTSEPNYIRLETRFLLSPSTRKLSLACRGLLSSVWLLLVITHFRVEADRAKVGDAIGTRIRPDVWNTLLREGLLVIVPERPDVEARRPSRARARTRSEERAKALSDRERANALSGADVDAGAPEEPAPDVGEGKKEPTDLRATVEKIKRQWADTGRLDEYPAEPSGRLAEIVADECRSLRGRPDLCAEVAEYALARRNGQTGT